LKPGINLFSFTTIKGGRKYSNTLICCVSQKGLNGAFNATSFHAPKLERMKEIGIKEWVKEQA
jgi:hypothetical protein